MIRRLFYWLASRKMRRAYLWVLHAVVVVAVVVGLWYVNRRFRLETDLLSPFPQLHPYWLPLLFVLVYAGAWLGYWFFRLLTDPAGGEHPDIDDAWADGLAALNAAGIDPREVPLLLVVGTPRSSTADFFAATKLPFAVRAEPRRTDAPVRVYATRDVVFVTCEGASALARASALLDAATAAAGPGGSPGTTGGPPTLLDDPDRPADVTAGDPAGPGREGGMDPASAMVAEWLPSPALGGATVLPTDERERLAGRLNYLCQVIAARRRPYCPANGIVWLLPIAATGSEGAADQIATACRADFLAAEAGLQVYCPGAAVVCDGQELPGFRDLLRGLSEPVARERLLGRSFPLIPGVPVADRPGVLHGGIDWVARHLVPGVAYQRFGIEAEGNGERWSAANARQWALTAELYERRAALARLVGQGLTDGSDRPPMLAGVYLAGTGPDEQDQAFAAAVVQQLAGLQNNVAWTAAAAAEERDYRRMAAVGYMATLGLVIAVAAFGYATWGR